MNFAKQVLSDPEKKQKYDRFGEERFGSTELRTKKEAFLSGFGTTKKGFHELELDLPNRGIPFRIWNHQKKTLLSDLELTQAVFRI